MAVSRQKNTSITNPHSLINPLVENVWVVLCFIAAAGFAVYRVQFFDYLFDEGFYLAAPYRYALGDIPFRDEFFNPLRMFDLILAPFFIVFPELTLYSLRLGWAMIQLISLIPLLILFSRFAPKILIAFACVASVWIPTFIWAPGYHTMSSTFFVLSWSLWLLGCLHTDRRSAIALAVASGIIFSIGAVSYVPLCAVGIVPAIVWVRERFFVKGSRHQCLATFVHLMTIGVVTLIGIMILSFSGLVTDWLDALSTINSVGLYKITLDKKVQDFVLQVIPYIPIFFLGIAVSVSLSYATRIGRMPVYMVIALVLFGLLQMLFFGVVMPPMMPLIDDDLTRPFRVIVFVVGLVAAFIVPSLFKRNESDELVDTEWRFVLYSLLSGSLIFAFLHAFLSSMAFKAMFAAPPLVVIASAVLYRALVARENPQTTAGSLASLSSIAVVTICLSIATVCYFTRAPQSAQIERVEFSVDRLHGIIADPVQVSQLEALLEALSVRIKEGDYLLAYDHLPLLYVLTKTRPAIDHAWATNIISGVVREKSLKKMQHANRVPPVAVRSLNHFTVDYENVIHQFVQQHYILDLELPGYEIWVHRDKYSVINKN